MPIYEYECQACGERHDALQKISEKPLRKCPACGKLKLKKLVSAAAFHLKGTGWYVTDFRDKDKPKAAEKSDASTGDSSTAKAGETKSADTKTTETKSDDAKPKKKAPGAKKGASSASAAAD
ncbi:MAG: zinc ribbon domain-containing protein [Planctomycetes bacterium]|nr:zinc ribbon domain-containing protein [Planctomycetota bacterium]